MKLHPFYFLAALGFLSVTSLTACSTATVPEGTHLPEVPEYVKVPHPVGFEMVDLKAMLLSPLAPKGVLGEFADSCDDEYRKLMTTTVSKDDMKRGAEELVSRDPERMHWCFYSKLSKLQDVLSSDATWTVRQKKVLDTYNFLSPVANAYVNVYQDSRYLRWASTYYTKISEWVFFRKVAPGPTNTQMLVKGNKNSELDPWVPVKSSGQAQNGTSVFDKYGINLAPTEKKNLEPAPMLPQLADQQAPAAVAQIPGPAPTPLPSPEQRAPASAAPSEVNPPMTAPEVAPPSLDALPVDQAPTDQAPQ